MSGGPPFQGIQIHTASKFKQTYSNKILSILSVQLLSPTSPHHVNLILFRLLDNNIAVCATIQFTSAILSIFLTSDCWKVDKP